MLSMFPFHGTDTKAALRTLITTVVIYTGLSLFAQLNFPTIVGLVISPIEVALWTFIAVAVVTTNYLVWLYVPHDKFLMYWIIPAMAIAAVAILQSEDMTADILLGPWEGAARKFEYIGNAGLGILLASGLMVLSPSPIRHAWLTRALVATIAFQALALLLELFESWQMSSQSNLPRGMILPTELAMLLCIEFFVVAVVLAGFETRAVEVDAATLIKHLPISAVGSKARLISTCFGVKRRYGHPPWKIAYYPVFQEITLGMAIAWLAWNAGPGVRTATGKPIWRQAVEMIRMWFYDGIDPPSYYAQEFYRPIRRDSAPEYLTRFETKNGLFGTLNKMRKSPYSTSEMSHKQLFYDCCRHFGLPYPQVLATTESGQTILHADRGHFQTSLFCKPQNGMGATGTLAFHFVSPDRYADKEGKTYDLEGVTAMVAKLSVGTKMLIQPWLKNHPDIADLAKDSLITFRVVTCIDEEGRPEVTLAMLRVLAKLESYWPDALDEEYAAPIDLASGRLGLFTGDNMTTSPLRYECHPLTGVKVNGRVIEQWSAIRELALKAHNSFLHRMLVGWDIALTPEGPVILEGNSNFDVMFLQRVHDLPAGRTRFGELLSHQLHTLAATLPERR